MCPALAGRFLSLELSYIGPHFSSRSAVSPVLRWHLNHPSRMPPSLQHLAGDFAYGRTSWEMLEPGQSWGELPCASEADAEWPSSSAACLPCAGCDLIGLDRRWQLWQVVSLVWTLVPSRCSRTASSDSKSWAFQLMFLPREMGAAGSVAGVRKQPVALEETCCKKRWKVLLSTRRHDLLWKPEKRLRKAQEQEAAAPSASENTRPAFQAWLCGSRPLMQPSFYLYKLDRTCFPKILFQIQYSFKQTYYIKKKKKKTHQGLFFTHSVRSSQVGWDTILCFHPSVLLEQPLSMCAVAKASLTLCDPMDYSLPGSSIRGIF